MAKFSDNDPLNPANVAQDIPVRDTAPGLEGDLAGQGTANTGENVKLDTPPSLSGPLPAPAPDPDPDPAPDPSPEPMPNPIPVPAPERPTIPNLPKPRKVMPELREDYIKAYKTYFMHTGDHQIAKELGLLELRRSWAETSADGSGRLTKHAPELEYPSLSAEVIKQRFETDLKAQGFDPETTFLKTDDQTRTESKTMHPTYALTVNGKALTLPDGAALRWKPNEGLFQIQIAANEDEENGDGGREKGNEANADDRKPQESNKGDHADECRSLEVDGYTINQKINKVSPEVNRRYSKLEGLRRDLVSEYRKYDENLAETLLKSIPRKIPKPNLPSAMLTLFRTAWNLASKLQERDKIDAKLNELEALKNQLVPEYESYLKKETELKWELRANTQKRERLNCG